MNIGIDQDSTLINVELPWAEYYNSRKDHCKHKSDVSSYALSWDYYMNQCSQCWKDVLNSNEVLSKATLMDGAEQTLERLQKQGHNLFLISTRPPEKGIVATELLERLGVLQYFMATSWNFMPKQQRCMAMHIDIMLDDKPTIVEDLQGVYTHPIIFDRPYNQGVRGDRIYHWSQFQTASYHYDPRKFSKDPSYAE